MQNQGQNDNNLLHFLKNQSLFNQQSPGRRMSSRSRDRKSNRGNSPNQQQYGYNTSAVNGYTQNSNMNIQDNYRNTYTNGVQNYTDYQGQGHIQGGNYQTTTTATNNYTTTGGQYNGNLQFNGDLNPQLMNTAANIVTYSSSFESARVETAQRLEGLANKVKTEINNLNYKIEMFNSQMLTVVTQEYNHIKERIYQCVEETFRESENYVREYMRAQEMKFAEEILRARESLQREISSIEAMREDINKPYWRNMAGVFITSEFEARIESVIKQCQTIQTKNIEFETAGFKLKDMENYLIESVRNRL